MIIIAIFFYYIFNLNLIIAVKDNTSKFIMSHLSPYLISEGINLLKIQHCFKVVNNQKVDFQARADERKYRKQIKKLKVSDIKTRSPPLAPQYRKSACF